MHSSRMRTARLLPVSPSMHCTRGVYLVGGQGVYLPRGVYLVPGVLPARGVCTCQGVYLLGGVPAQVLPPLWTEFWTHASENITLPQTSFAGGNYTLGYPGYATEQINSSLRQTIGLFFFVCFLLLFFLL